MSHNKSVKCVLRRFGLDIGGLRKSSGQEISVFFFLSVYLASYHRKRDVVGQQTLQPSCHRQFLNDDQVLGYFEYLDKVSLGSLINVQSFRQFDTLIIKHEAKPVVCLDIVVLEEI